jgi:hypothetical protein
MAQGDVPTTPPIITKIDGGALARELWGDEWHKHEVVYIFRNGRKFESSDYGTSGIYKAPA